jgi:hypothetical protein
MRGACSSKLMKVKEISRLIRQEKTPGGTRSDLHHLYRDSESLTPWRGFKRLKIDDRDIFRARNQRWILGVAGRTPYRTLGRIFIRYPGNYKLKLRS